ncbi:MAG: hypothetical protein P1V35_17165, partial [Planctomycetota bacterium]|nr:hypothetical protein [Planctomycetota bacterium]
GGRCVVSHSDFQDVIIPYDNPSPGVVHVELDPLPKITGRIVGARGPMAGLRFEVCPVEIRKPVSGQPEELRAQIARHPERCLSYDAVWVETDSEGRFEFVSKPKSNVWYRLQAHGAHGDTVEHWFQIEPTVDPDHDLGDLHLAPSGILRGRVQVPDGVDPTGLVFLLDLDSSCQSATANAEGEFVIQNVAPGQHFLQVRETARLAPLPDSYRFSMEPGQVLEQEFDLRSLGLSQRHVKLTRNGQPLAQYRVFLRVAQPGKDTPWHESLLGFTDAHGSVTGTLPAAGLASVWIQSLDGESPVQHPSAMVPLT